MEKYNLRKISKILIKHFSIILNFIYEPNSEDIGDFGKKKNFFNYGEKWRNGEILAKWRKMAKWRNGEKIDYWLKSHF